MDPLRRIYGDAVTLQTLVNADQNDNYSSLSFQFGTLFVLIPILLYNEERGTVQHEKLNRWFFYAYYPAYMIVLLAVKEILHTY